MGTAGASFFFACGATDASMYCQSQTVSLTLRGGIIDI